MTKNTCEQITFDVSNFSLESVATMFSTYRAEQKKSEGSDQASAIELSSDASSLTPAPLGVRPTAESIAEAESTGWTAETYQLLLDRLDTIGREPYADLLEAAIETGGSLDRDSVYGVMGWDDGRQMKGFTRPFRTAMKYLISSGKLPETAAVPLDAEYDENIKGYQKAIGVVVAVDLLKALGTTAV